MPLTVLSSLATAIFLMAIALVAVVFYRLGFRLGSQAGEDAAVLRLARHMEPGVRDAAHSLVTDIDTERNTPGPFPAQRR